MAASGSQRSRQSLSRVYGSANGKFLFPAPEAVLADLFSRGSRGEADETLRCARTRFASP
jgi:hypothetical protein